MLYKNETIDNAAVGSFIRSARKMKGYTQASLAKAIDIDPKYISQFENCKALPSTGLLMALSDELGVSMEFLIRGTEASGKSIDKGTMFCIPEAKGLSKEEYHFTEKSVRDMVKNLKKTKS